MWWKKRNERKELDDNASEDLELVDEDAEKVAGGIVVVGGSQAPPVPGTTDAGWK